MAVITIILSLVVFLNFLLGIFSITQNRKSFKNIFFAVLCFFAAIWTFTNLITGIYATSFWLKSTYSFGSLVIASGVVWVLILTDKPKKFLKKTIFIYFIAGIFFIASFFDGFIAKTYNDIYPGGTFTGETGPGMILYFIFFLSAGFFMIYKLIFGYVHAVEREEKMRLKYILYGAFATLSVSFLTSFLFPVLNIYQFSGMDSVGFLIFLFCFSYAVIEYRFLDIRVVATQIFVFGVWILLLIRTILSENSQDFLINGGMLVALIVMGSLLNRAVSKELKQREQLEKMAEEVKRAYEVEKLAKEQTERAYGVEKKANEELEKLDKTKNQFLMAVQHHLKTPLTSMMGYSDLLLSGAFGKQNKKTIEVIKKFEVSTTGLIKMVNEFLDITQFQLGKGVVNPKPNTDIMPIIEQIVSELKFQAEQKGLYLKLEKQGDIPLISVDTEKLRAALLNIFDNSIKYTQKGGLAITINLGSNQNSNGGGSKPVLLITSKDTGIGMSKERLAKLFNSTFERGDDAKKTNVTGRGVGLYLSSEIIKAHNGKVWAESEGEGKGSTFFIELPVDPVPSIEKNPK